MSKAVLVIDMPESINGETPCKHCSLHVAEYDDYYHHYVCQGIQTFDFDGDEWEIYNKCPLKPLVEVIPIEFIEKWLRRKKQRWVDTDAFIDLINDWREENEID